MAREEGEKLLNALLPFAEQMLAKHGTFHPFGAFLDPKGEVCLLGAHDGRENPSSVELIDLMVASMKKEAPEKGYLAVGICSDVMILLTTQKSDAIQVAIEYADGEAVDVYLPYKKKWFGKIQHGKPVCFSKRTENLHKSTVAQRNRSSRAMLEARLFQNTSLDDSLRRQARLDSAQRNPRRS